MAPRYRESPGMAQSRWPPPLFPDTEISEDHIQDVLHVDSAQKLAQCPGRQAKVFRHDFLAALLGCASRTLERKSGFSQMRALALPRDQRRLRCEEARCKYRKLIH